MSFHLFLARYFLIMVVSTLVQLLTATVFSSGLSQGWLRASRAVSLLAGLRTNNLGSVRDQIGKVKAEETQIQ